MENIICFYEVDCLCVAKGDIELKSHMLYALSYGYDTMMATAVKVNSVTFNSVKCYAYHK